MSGKPGQVSKKPAALPERYSPGFLARMDGRGSTDLIFTGKEQEHG